MSESVPLGPPANPDGPTEEARASSNPQIEQARRDISTGNLGSAIRALQRVGTAGDLEVFEAMVSLADEIRERTSKRRERAQAEAIISHARSVIWRIENPVDVPAGPIAVLSMSVLGGDGLGLPRGAKVDVRFQMDRIELVELRRDHSQPVSAPYVPYEDVVALEIGGPGATRTSGRFFGGGFGLQGAAEGMLIASAINLLTTRTSIDTVLCIQTKTAELFLANHDETPNALRMRLSLVLTILRQREQAKADRPSQTDAPATAVDQLAKLSGLLDRGLIDEDEFRKLKGEILS